MQRVHKSNGRFDFKRPARTDIKYLDTSATSSEKQKMQMLMTRKYHSDAQISMICVQLESLALAVQFALEKLAFVIRNKKRF